jgi:hypothetical protein
MHAGSRFTAATAVTGECRSRQGPRYHPIGQLSFEFEQVYVFRGSAPRRSFRDAKVQRLENMASDIAVGLAVLAAAKTEERLRREVEQRRIEEERRRRELAVRRISPLFLKLTVDLLDLDRSSILADSLLEGVAFTRDDSRRLWSNPSDLSSGYA